MSTLIVKELLKEIESLGEGDRLALEKELSKRLEKRWLAEAGKARLRARKQKLTQASIDAAIEGRRYRR